MDVGAREEIFALIGRLVAQGMAVLLISSDLPEVMNLSHRLALYRDGRIVRQGGVRRLHTGAGDGRTYQDRSSLRPPIMKHLRTYLPLLAAIALLLTVFALWVPHNRFLTAGNLMDLAQQISVNAILAFGLTLVILIGGIDLSVGAVVALAGVVCVSVLNVAGSVGGLAAGLGAALLIGVANGLCAARTRMPPFIITLATMLVARGLALGFNESRPLPIGESQSFMLALGNARLGGWLPLPVVVMLVVFAVTAVLLHRTRFGQHLFAIGGNREAARFTGIAIARHEVAVYALCGLRAGLAGMIHASQLYSAEPAAGQGFELNAIAAVVVGGTSYSGGTGTLPGTLLGAIIIGILDKGLNQAGVHFSLQYI